MENVGIFMTIWSTYFTPNWCILWTFGIFCGRLVYFSRFGLLYQKKSGNPAAHFFKPIHLIFVPVTRNFFMNVKCGLTFQIQSNNYIWGPFRET
jgi:hypothetical protein